MKWGKVKKETERPCFHDSCNECHGTGIKENGQLCIHMISCPCPKCRPFRMIYVERTHLSLSC